MCLSYFHLRENFKKFQRGGGVTFFMGSKDHIQFGKKSSFFSGGQSDLTIIRGVKHLLPKFKGGG